jgi:hypothetical protein
MSPWSGRSILPSLLGVVGNPSIEYTIMVRCRSGVPSWVGPIMMAPEPSQGGRGSGHQISQQ